MKNKLWIILLSLFAVISFILILLFCNSWMEKSEVPTNTIWALDKNIANSCNFSKYQVLELTDDGRFVFYDIDKKKQSEGRWEKHFFCSDTLVFEYQGKKETVIFEDNRIDFDDSQYIFPCHVPSAIYIKSSEWTIERFPTGTHDLSE